MLRTLKTIKLVFNANNLLPTTINNKINQCVQYNFLLYQTVSSGANYMNDSETEEKPKRKKTQRIPKITLIHEDESITITLLENAQKLAKRLKLQLELVTEEDPKSGRSVYKLIDISKALKPSENMHRTDTKKKFKTTKLFTLKTKIADHDLNTKITNINKVLKRNHKVKVFLSHPDGKQEDILKSLKNKIEGTVSAEKFQKHATIVTFSPLEIVETDFLENDDISNNSK